ncbi:SPOR domain-containing protein [Candidatus Halobeggiatoa sp. HSG11]|nr:SPOR domain-containing protein [Candidatus Halobeggiatoa sp. HSG11]
MPLRNVRRQHNIAAEQYDPKQRIVGGIVLFLMMLLIYGVLKLLLVISAPDKFAIDKALEFESFSIASSESVTSPSNDNANESFPQLTHSLPANIPKKFVFLDLNGNSMQQESIDITTPSNAPNNLYSSNGEERWYVQVASFKDKSRAQRLANQIKAKNIATEVYIVPTGNWFAVRLPPQTSRNAAQQQKNRLRRALAVRPKVNKIK